MINLEGRMGLKFLNDIVVWAYIHNFQGFSNLTSSAYHSSPIVKWYVDSYMSHCLDMTYVYLIHENLLRFDLKIQISPL